MPQLVSEIMQRWATARGLGLPHPNTITELVSLEGGPGRGGGTRRVAALLYNPKTKQRGIDVREVQRYMVQEAGAGAKAKQARGSEALQARREEIRGLIAARTPDGRVRKYGIEVSLVQAEMGRSRRWEPGRVVTDVDVPGAALTGFLKAIRRDDWDEAARELEETWADAYEAPLLLWGDAWEDGQHVPIVDALSMEIGAGGTVRRKRRSS